MSGEKRAAKIVEKDYLDMKSLAMFKEEINNLKNLDHPNIIHLFDVYEDEVWIHLVTDLCEGRELFEEIISRQQFSEKDAASII